MASSVFPLLLLLLLTLSYSYRVQSHEEGYIKAEISNRGLDFLKDLLIAEAESSLVPLNLPDIEKHVRIPILGRVQMVLSNITIETIHVTSSTLKTGDSGIVIDVSGATANLSMNWKYSYSTWLLPIALSDKGSATVQVEGLEVGLTLSLKTTLEGSLKLSVLECGCYVNNMSIKLDGGASWLYQGLVDAFEDQIRSAVEDAVSKNLKESISKLDNLLRSFPNSVPITNIATLNVTFVDDPVLSGSSLGLEINGLFESVISSHYRSLRDTFPCNEEDKMVGISLHENVLKSVSSVYFRATKMHWIVDNAPDESLLNTAGWRFIVPKLYKMYPDHDMNLNISLSSPPIIEVEKQQIKATIPINVVIDVLDAEEVVPVLCVSVVIRTSGSVEMSGDTLTGGVKLNDFTMSLNWSQVGDLHMRLIQTVMSTTLKTVILPYINSKLKRGLRLPVFHGYKLEDAQVLCTDAWIVICSDVTSV